MRSRRTVGFAVAVLALVSAVGPYALAGRPSASVADVDRAGSAIRRMGETVYPHLYAGVSVDERSRTVHLQVTSLGALSGMLVRAAGAVPVSVEIVPRSFADLSALQERVLRDDPLWASRGVSLSVVGPNYPRDTVRIGVRPYSRAIAGQMRTRYGASNVDVFAGEPAVTVGDRFHDTSPYNGGDEVYDAGGNTCTAGFGIHNGGGQASTGGYLILAGHCFANGVAIYHNGTRIGTSSRSSSLYKNYGDDVELISVSSSRYIWESNSVRGSSDGDLNAPAIGSSVCHSGVATDKRCGTLVHTNQCPLDTDTNLHLCHEDSVTSSGLLVAGGDSGGPWFTDRVLSDGSHLFEAVGIESLAGSPTYTCNTQLGSNTKCSHTAYYLEAFQAMWTDYGKWVNYS